MARRSRSYQRRQERRAARRQKEAGLSAYETPEAVNNVAAKNAPEIALAYTVLNPKQRSNR
ncbi:hypothetical protein [Azospirillum palustre]